MPIGFLLLALQGVSELIKRVAFLQGLIPDPSEKIVEKTADFAAAFERAVSAGKPAIIHMKTDPEALTSRITLSKLREQSLARQH